MLYVKREEKEDGTFEILVKVLQKKSGHVTLSKRAFLKSCL
jgi:hypothetical protein